MTAARDVWITPDADVRITPDADVVIVNDGSSTITVGLAATSRPIAVGVVYTAPGELTPAGDASALLLWGDQADDAADGFLLWGDQVGAAPDFILVWGDQA